MPNPVNPVPTRGRPDTAVRPDASARPDAGARPSAAAALGQQRARANADIVEASARASIRAGNEPLALLFRSAIEQINEMLKPTLGENAIQNAVNEDNTPEGTASRIVSLSTGFFEAFRQQHPDEAEPDVLKKFMETIRSGFEQGFSEARSILDGLGVLDGEIAAGIDRTHELVLEGYAKFEQEHGAASESAAA